MDNNLNVRGVNVLVCVDEMASKNAGEELWRVDWVLLGSNVDSVLHAVCCYYHAVIGPSVTVSQVSRKLLETVIFDLRGLDLSLQQHTDSHLGHSLGSSGLVALDLVDTDIVLAITCICYRSHC